MSLLLRTDGLKAGQKAALKRLMPYFDAVGEVLPSQIDWSALRFDRNSRSYRMLLYAKTDETIVPDGCFQRSDGNTIWFRTLDLGAEFRQIREQLDSILELCR